VSLPRSVNTTYVAGSTPAIKADDLNELQQRHVDTFWRRPLICDDFTGDSLNRGNWKNIATAGSGSATFVDDAANGGNGVYKFDVSAAAANTISLQPGGNWNLNSEDYHIRFRARTTGVVANTTFFVGFVTTVGFEVLGSSSTTLWRV
jgi:hypothetical protein